MFYHHKVQVKMLCEMLSVEEIDTVEMELCLKLVQTF